MNALIWIDWLRAQKYWAAMMRQGYRYHTPESVYLCTVSGRPLDALDYVAAGRTA